MIEFDPMKNDENLAKHQLPLHFAELVFTGLSSRKKMIAMIMAKPALSRPVRSHSLAIAYLW